MTYNEQRWKRQPKSWMSSKNVNGVKIDESQANGRRRSIEFWKYDTATDDGLTLLEHWRITIGVKGAAKDEFRFVVLRINSERQYFANKQIKLLLRLPSRLLAPKITKSRDGCTSNGKIYCLSRRKGMVNFSIKCLASIWPTSRLRH